MLRCGLSVSQVEGMVGRGAAAPVRRGVYLLGPMPGNHGEAMAAVLACGPHAWLSHRSATERYEMLARREVVACGTSRSWARTAGGIRAYGFIAFTPFRSAIGTSTRVCPCPRPSGP